MPRLSPLFEALASPIRRRIMFALLDCAPDEAVSVEPNAGLFERSDLRALQIELRHVHLPYLSEYGFVDWCRTEQRVSPGPEFEPVREPLAALRQYAEANELA